MYIQILSESARSKHPIPATIEKALATVKPKARVVFAQPGRYVLKSRTGLFSIFRISKEAKYTPSMKNRLFAQREMEALASDGLWDIDPDGPYSESITDLEAEALSFEEDFERESTSNSNVGNQAAYKAIKQARLPSGYSINYDGFEDGVYSFELTKSNVHVAFRECSDVRAIPLAVQDLVDYSRGRSSRGDGSRGNEAFISVSSIESESAAPARGKGNVGSKMGRKKRSPGMLAPGWHVFHQPASGGPMRKYYAGPRIAARRIAGIMNGEEVPEGRKKSPNETASKTRKARVTREPKAPVKAPDTYKMYKNIVKLQQKVERIKQRMDNTDNKEKKKELAQQARDLNAEIRPLQRDLRKAEKLIEKTPTSRQIKVEQAKKRSGTKSSSPDTKNTGKSSRLDNPSQNKGQSYNEWKASVTKAYGRGVKFVSYDVPSSGVSAELKGKLVDYYSLDLDAK
tara:strand:+ start:64663 stop:66033 length:1371 start_codon:yes stop_codon:yes gene_type:complete